VPVITGILGFMPGLLTLRFYYDFEILKIGNQGNARAA
jgi:hypothetical protein